MKKVAILIGIAGLFFLGRPVFAAEAVAVIQGTEEGSKLNGKAVLTEKDGGLEIVVNVSDVPPGEHAFHIHEKGDCGDMGKAAGGHYNPDNVQHGHVIRDGFEHAHAGDFGNIKVDEKGKGALTIFIPKLTLSGEQYNVAGKAVILHEKKDDFGQPTGNAGGRIGCGLITPMAEAKTK